MPAEKSAQLKRLFRQFVRCLLNCIGGISRTFVQLTAGNHTDNTIIQIAYRRKQIIAIAGHTHHDHTQRRPATGDKL
jgi:hypothetical protein